MQYLFSNKTLPFLKQIFLERVSTCVSGEGRREGVEGEGEGEGEREFQVDSLLSEEPDGA